MEGKRGSVSDPRPVLPLHFSTEMVPNFDTRENLSFPNSTQPQPQVDRWPGSTFPQGPSARPSPNAFPLTMPTDFEYLTSTWPIRLKTMTDAPSATMTDAPSASLLLTPSLTLTRVGDPPKDGPLTPFDESTRRITSLPTTMTIPALTSSSRSWASVTASIGVSGLPSSYAYDHSTSAERARAFNHPPQPHLIGVQQVAALRMRKAIQKAADQAARNGSTLDQWFPILP